MNRPTHADTILRMLAKGANRNWVNMIARENGIDFDEDTKDEFNRDNENL